MLGRAKVGMEGVSDYRLFSNRYILHPLLLGSRLRVTRCRKFLEPCKLQQELCQLLLRPAVPSKAFTPVLRAYTREPTLPADEPYRRKENLLNNLVLRVLCSLRLQDLLQTEYRRQRNQNPVLDGGAPYKGLLGRG